MPAKAQLIVISQCTSFTHRNVSNSVRHDKITQMSVRFKLGKAV